MFYLIAAIAVVSAAAVVLKRNVMHSALFLALFLLSVAGLFILLDADFLAAVQIILYAGGVMVLILFAIMLTHRISDKLLAQTNRQKWIAVPLCALIFGLVFILLGDAVKAAMLRGAAKPIDGSMTSEMGRLLMTVYGLPFEIASLMLLAALVGTIVIGLKDGNE